MRVKHKSGLEGTVIEEYDNAYYVHWDNGTKWSCWQEELV